MASRGNLILHTPQMLKSTGKPWTSKMMANIFMTTLIWMTCTEAGRKTTKSSFGNLVSVDLGKTKPLKVHKAAGQGMQIADGFEQERERFSKIATFIKNSSPP